MIRVLQVFDSLETSGGVQAVVMNTYRAIDKTRVQFDFAVYDSPEKNSYREEIENYGGHVIPIDNLGTAGIAGFYKQFEALFLKTEYDAVHAHNIHHNGLILLAAKNACIPIRISHCHQAFDERNVSIGRKALATALKTINNHAATRKVACSDLAGKFLYGKNEFEFLPNAINLDRYNDLPSKYELRHKNGYTDDSQIIIAHIGRFSPPKNQFFLVDILEQLREENVKLVIAGSGPLQDKVLDAFESRGLSDKVDYLGLRDDVPEILAMSDCMVLPSIYEGLPVVAVEAQAALCPCLISDKVTRQADIGVGLVQYIPIVSADIWADCIKSINKTRLDVNRTEVMNKLRNFRFDARTNLEAWYELYGE